MTILRSLLLVALLALLAGAAVAADDDRRVRWLTYREALDTASGQGKPVLLHFTASHSGGCRKMKRTTYADRAVIRRLNDDFTACRIDIERLPSLGEKYGVEALPTVWFLDARGRPLTSVQGEVGPEKMLRITEYIRDRIYEHTDYRTWLDKRGR